MRSQLKIKFIPIGVVLVLVLMMNSCGINSNLMFKTTKDYVFDSLPDTANFEYKLSVNDEITFRLYSNQGFKILDIVSGESSTTANNNQSLSQGTAITYKVEQDSTVKLPIVGKVQLVGMTLDSCENYLEKVYSDYYIEPFIQIRVINNRVIVFPGNGGQAKVVTLKNNNTTLLEALALAGGITDRGKAKKIKVMRMVEGKREVYLIDLSTIDGIAEADLVVQAMDYIYVEPVPQISRELLAEIAPILGIITSAAAVVVIIQSFTK
ncbi:MAG: polysaccharide biosynthesis/export family protein [Crocinitomicaceae bacterium]|nr:polysaccharide biosynthesis/export family protein [Crocinitomicaceae bacterium]